MLEKVLKKELGARETVSYAQKILFKNIKEISLMTFLLMLLSLITELNKGNSVLYAILLVLTSVFSLTIMITSVYITENQIVNGEMDKIALISHIKMSSSRLIPYLFTVILTTILIIIAYVLFIIPGIIASVWFSFVVYASILKGKNGFAALSYSKEIVEGQWWGILWKSTKLLIVIGLVSFSVVLISKTILHFLPHLVSIVIFNFIFQFLLVLSMMSYTLFFMNQDYLKKSSLSYKLYK